MNRLTRNLSIFALSCCAASSCITMAYAGGFESTGKSNALETVASARNSEPRAFLDARSLQAHSIQALWPSQPISGPGHSIESLAAKISFIGGLLLTADQVMRSVDSVMEAATYRRPDGSYLRLNAEPMSRGFLLGVIMSRPIDF